MQSLPSVLVALERIKEHNLTSPKTASEADGLSHVEFKCELLHIWIQIYSLLLECNTVEDIHIIPNYLQKELLDVNTAVQLIDTCMAQLKEMHTHRFFFLFEEMIETGREFTGGGEAGDEHASTVRWQKTKWSKIPKHICGILFPYLRHPCATVWDTLCRFLPNGKTFLHSEPQKRLRRWCNRIQDLDNFYVGDVSTAEQVLDVILSFRATCSKLEIKINTPEAGLPFIMCNDMERAFSNISI